jgi:hypothetical protein
MRGNISDLVSEWTQRTFCMRSGFYAGRNPAEYDLGTKHLEMIYAGIKADVGQEEASNFVRFVNKLDDMAATPFIVAFEKFWARDCQMTDVSQNASDRLQLDAHGEALEGQAFGAIMSTMFGRVSEEEYQRLSDSVKARFIRDHLGEIPEDERRELKGGYVFG